MKTPVVFLPALLCNAGLFIHQIKTMESECDFYVPDLGLDENVSDAAARVLKRAPERFVLGGISMGGYVALEIMRQAPERVRGLILADTNAHADPEAAREKRLKAIETAREKGIEPLIKPTLLDIIAPEHRSNDVTRHILERMAELTGVDKYVNEQKTIMSRPDSTASIGKIDCPVLVVGGEKDALSPPDALDAMTRLIPRAAHVVIKNAAHLPPLENPAAFTAALRAFIEKIS